MTLLPKEILAGQWRILTHPFVHVSWYHLLLDGAAFFILYAAFRTAFLRRLAYVVPALGSMTAAMISPRGSGVLPRGLSGLGHGLMAVCT